MIKCAYYLKLFLIVALTIILLASIEVAPEHPLIFVLVLVGVIYANRMLWHSALKIETQINQIKPMVRQRAAPKSNSSKKKAA